MIFRVNLKSFMGVLRYEWFSVKISNEIKESWCGEKTYVSGNYYYYIQMPLLSSSSPPPLSDVNVWVKVPSYAAVGVLLLFNRKSEKKRKKKKGFKTTPPAFRLLASAR